MNVYSVEQDLSIFDLYRKGKGLILNPSELRISVADEPHNDDGKGYSKGKYSCYELADIQIKGLFNGAPAEGRPFMFYLKILLEENHRHHVKPIIERNMSYDRREKGWYVDWDSMSEELKILCEQTLAQDVSIMLQPITSKSQKKKTKAGYGDTTLYASGQLFQAVMVEVE